MGKKEQTLSNRGPNSPCIKHIGRPIANYTPQRQDPENIARWMYRQRMTMYDLSLMSQPSPARRRTQCQVPKVRRTEPLPSAPSKSGVLKNAIGVTCKWENDTPVTASRNSAASSFWCCAGREGKGTSEKSELPNNVISEAVPGGPVFIFRNDEERQQDCRIIATLRESRYKKDDTESSGPPIPRCRRDCAHCQRQEHQPPQIMTYVTNATAGSSSEQGSWAASEAEFAEFIGDDAENLLLACSQIRRGF